MEDSRTRRQDETFMKRLLIGVSIAFVVQTAAFLISAGIYVNQIGKNESNITDIYSKLTTIDATKEVVIELKVLVSQLIINQKEERIRRDMADRKAAEERRKLSEWQLRKEQTVDEAGEYIRENRVNGIRTRGK